MNDEAEMLVLLNKAWEARPELGDATHARLEQSEDGVRWRLVQSSGRCSPAAVAETGASIREDFWVRAVFRFPAPGGRLGRLVYLALRRVPPQGLTRAALRSAELSARTGHPGYCAVFMLALEERRDRDDDFSIELDEHLHNPPEPEGLAL